MPRFHIPLIVPVLVVATMAAAHDGVKDPTVLARMNGMSDLGAATKVLGEMATGKTPFDASAAQIAADQLAARAGQIAAEFQDPATDPKSEALPNIWEEFDAFTAIATDLETAATGAQWVSTQAELTEAFAAIGQTCRDCHRTYRKR